MTKLEQLSEKADKIYLDVDGVLFASNEAMCKLLNRKYGLNHTGDEVTDWNYTDLYPTNSDEVESLFDSKEFFQNVNFVKGAKRYLTKYRKKIIIVSKCNFRNYLHKRLYFNDKGFKDVPIIPVPLDMSKNIINMKGGLFIDDCAINLKESNATYKVMFMEYDDDKKRSWQKGFRGIKITEW
jgi:5'(3')-deoxyribonucleotidase